MTPPTPPPPGQTHPDVAIVKTILRETKPGEICPYKKIEKAIGCTRKEHTFRSRCNTARRQLAHEMQFSAVPGEGFLRETAEQTKERVEGPEARSQRRRADKNATALDTIELAELPNEKARYEVLTAKVQQHLIKEVTSKKSTTKLLKAVQATGEVPAVANALRALTNGRIE